MDRQKDKQKEDVRQIINSHEITFYNQYMKFGQNNQNVSTSKIIFQVYFNAFASMDVSETLMPKKHRRSAKFSKRLIKNKTVFKNPRKMILIQTNSALFHRNDTLQFQ